MKTCKSLAALVLGLAICAPASSQPPPPNNSPDTKRIDTLIKQLGSPRYSEREQAQKDLEALGTAALPALRKAIKEGDAEIGKRAADMVGRLEEKTSTDKLLAPTKVKLTFKDTPVADAVTELAKQSGYVITLENPGSLAGRKVTLETGEVSFFEALDKLCAAAGLVEKTQSVPTVGPRPIRPNFKVRPPVQPVPVPKQPVQPLKGIEIKAPAADEAKPAQPNPQGGLGLAEIIKALEGIQLGQPDPAAAKALEERARVVEAQIEARMAQLLARQNERLAQIQALPIQLPALPQIQIPLQPGQVIPFQAIPQIGGPIQPGFGPAQQQPRQFILADGKPAEYPTVYNGAVRIRILPASVVNQKGQPGELLLAIEVTAEPRLKNFMVTSPPSIVRAVDSEDQKLASIDQPANNPGLNPNIRIAVPNFQFPNPFNQINAHQQRFFPVRLKLGEKQAKSLKELVGSVTISIQLPVEPVATIDNVLKAAGQSVKHKDNETNVLTLQSIEKLGDNGYLVKMTMDSNANNQNPFGGGFGGVQIIGNAQIQIGGFGNIGPAANQGLPELIDAKGKAYQALVTQNGMQFNNGAFKRMVTVEYRANAGQEAPARLVLSEARNSPVAVPFTFKNVPVQ